MMLDFGEAVRQFYKNYTNPDGRAQRSAFWWVKLYEVILISVCAIVVLMADGGSGFIEQITRVVEFEEVVILWADLGSSGKFAVIAVFAFSLVNFLPGIMLNIRRFHDLDRSGWLVLGFFLIGSFPVIGTLASLGNLVWFSMPGTAGSNRYGADPLGNNNDTFG